VSVATPPAGDAPAASHALGPDVAFEHPVQPRASRLPYLSLGARNAIAAAVALVWALASLWVALPWIRDLGASLTVPVAAAIIAGIAILPGYLNAHLVASLALDRPKPVEDDLPAPPVTVLIAAYNEAERIADTVSYALASDFPGHVTVMVCDDGSSDGTGEIVAAIAADDARVRLVSCPHGGKASALNHGLVAVDTPFIATCDADTLLMPWALRRAAGRLAQSPPDTVCVAGSVMVRNSRTNLLAAMQSWDYLLGIASVKREQSLMRGTLVAQGAFSVYRTDAVRDAGGWPDMIGEDIVLTWAMLAAGGRSTYEPTAIAFTDVPTGFRHFVRQRQRWARGMVEGLRIHGSTLLRAARLYTHAVAVNLCFPLMDLAFTCAFLPGLVLAATGNYAIVGPVTLAVLPLNLAILGLMARRQRATFASMGLVVRRHRRAFLAYFLLYQLILSPVSLAGYAKEFARARRRW